MLDDETQLPAWVQAKLTKASSMMSAVFHYLDYVFHICLTVLVLILNYMSIYI